MEGRVGKPYLDVGGEQDNTRSPFYYPKNVLSLARDRGASHGGFWYEDSPGRIVGTYSNRNVYFMAETSLIGFSNGSWRHVTSYSWGFSIKNGNEVIRTPINQTSFPSFFNLQIINMLNGK